MSILNYFSKQSSASQGSSRALSLPVHTRASQTSIEETEGEDARDMEFAQLGSGRRDPASDLLVCSSCNTVTS